MKVKITFILVFSFLFFGFKVANATLVVNEIMYNPAGTDTGHEWLEVYNNDSISAVDLSKWYFFSDNTKHSLSAQGSSILPVNGYAIIAQDPVKFTLDWPSFSGLVFDSSWGDLNNTTGETIALKDSDLNLVSETTYLSSTGGGDDGNSLQRKNDNTWFAATPTPGQVNENNNVLNPPTTSGGGGVANVAPEIKPKVVEIPKIKTKIIANSLVYVGIPFDLAFSTLGYSNEIRNYGRYFCNFGDGDSKEINLNQNTKFSHIYYYEGEYEVTLEYYSNYYGDTPDTVNKIIIKVIPATVFISRIGDEKDFFIELSNNSDYDVDISKWIISSNSKTFTLPKNTNIGAKSKMILSPKITNFMLDDKTSLKLLKSTGEVAFDYSASIEVIKNIPEKIINKIVSTPINATEAENAKKASGDLDIILPNNNENENFDLAASPILSNENNVDIKNKSYFFFWSFVVLLIVSSVAVYYIRQNKNVSKEGDDFDILDE
jgi:hypothetical protein